MNNQELVSVIIPTYGRPNNLERAINSVLASQHENTEIIVVDDNNPNSQARFDTESVILKYLQLNNLKYIKHDKNRNGAFARNTGVSHSLGNYICFLDDDDEFKPQKIDFQLKTMKELKSNLCYCQFELRKESELISTSIYSQSGDLRHDVLCSIAEFNSSCLMLTKDLFKKVEGFDIKFKRNQDLEFLIRCMNFENITCCPKNLVIRHVDSQINQPPLKEYIKTRKDFKKKFDWEISKLTVKERLDFTSFYNFDLAYYALRKRNYIKAMEYLFFVIPTPFFIKNIYYKLKRRSILG